ncbi:MAG: precorrin-6y C5,15-methyltransferase (decarboxylating) subunit CbiE [Gammaproteobacteria bacterium]|nr:precorrin-6y C5,15-methyltransferase (decarboxylating) subunit CbiE [Gammaproteobacteria bacterium]MDH5802177.1 precorrin-6y C5,15-methyltransferase (decarboxylating) subunit CbiE [Gammaproteobacteria bacterium]
MLETPTPETDRPHSHSHEIAPQCCHIIGVLENAERSLSETAITLIQQADLIIGGRRTLELLKGLFHPNSTQKDLSGQLRMLPQWIEDALAQQQTVVVLASGDPLCHGIGKYLVSKLGTQRCHIHPNLSAHQLAFAELGLAWQHAHICSVHSKDAGEWEKSNKGPQHGLFAVLQAIQQHDLIAVYTSPDNSPDRIARLILEEQQQACWDLHVTEDLLGKQQRVYRGLSAEQAVSMQFVDPNIVILQRRVEQTHKALFGLQDSVYKQRKPDKGLITKREVRAVSLARMQLRRDSIVWDIGAGSGSVGLEAARLCSQGYVYAVEKNPDDAAIAVHNQREQGILNYQLTHDKAPQPLHNWPDPDAVFIGGSGGELQQLIELCLQRLRPDGTLVMNFVTLENLSTATDALSKAQVQWDVTQLQANRSQPILHMHRLAAENPVWIVCAQPRHTEDHNMGGNHD